MKVTKLEDKLKTGFRYRLDDLTTRELVEIEMAIKRCLKEEKKFAEKFQNDDDYEKSFKKNNEENISNYSNIINAIDNEKVMQIDCYRCDVSDMEFEKIIKKYKKVKK